MSIANVALTDTYDQWRIRTNQIILFANEIETRQNAVFDTLNASYTVANSGYGVANSGYDKTNLVFTTTNAVYTQSNTDNIRLTSAYVSSNGAWIRANAMYEFSNLIFDTLNAAYTMANADYVVTNAAYTHANNAHGRIDLLAGNANSQIAAFQISYDTLNASYSTANAAFGRLNTAFTTTNAAYTMLNTAFTTINAAWTMGNANYTTTNSAFARANAALPNTTSTYDGTMTITGNIGVGVVGSSAYRANIAGDFRASANVVLGDAANKTITFFGSRVLLANNTLFANTGNTLFVDVQNSRISIGNTNPPATANVYVAGSANVDQVLTVNGVNVAPTLTSAYGSLNLAFTTVNAAYVMANANYTVTNAVFTLANAESVRLTAAFGRANNTVPATTGGAFTGDISVYRSASPSTGYMFLNSGGTRSLGFDGSNYQMPGSNLFVNGNLVWTAGNDGAGSGLDADLLDGLNQTSASTGSTIAARDSNGDSNFRYVNASYMNSSDDVNTGNLTYIMGKFGDNYFRSATAAKVAAFISGQSMNIAGNATTAGNITAYTINQNLGTGNSPTFSTVYAQQFIDSNDGNYYLDPNSISYLNDTRSNVMYDRENTGYYIFSWDGAGHGNARLRNVYVDYLQSYGTIYSNGNITAYSDRRLKTNLQPITDWKPIMRGLKGYRFEWNAIGKKLGMGDGIEVGLITQEVEAVLPQATAVQMSQYVDVNNLTPRDDINYDPTAPYKTVKEEKIIPVLVEAVNGLMTEIEELKAELKALKGQ